MKIIQSMVRTDFFILDSLPSNTLSLGLVICPMDDTDIERAEKQNYLVQNMND